MGRILHEELHFHPYKMVIVQELTERDFTSRKNAEIPKQRHAFAQNAAEIARQNFLLLQCFQVI